MIVLLENSELTIITPVGWLKKKVLERV